MSTDLFGPVKNGPLTILNVCAFELEYMLTRLSLPMYNGPRLG